MYKILFFVVRLGPIKNYEIVTFYQFQKNIANFELNLFKVKLINNKPMTLKSAILKEINFYNYLKELLSDYKYDFLEVLDFKIEFKWSDSIYDRLEEIIFKLKKINFPIHVEFSYLYCYLFSLSKTIGQYCPDKCVCDKQINIYLIYTSNNKLGFHSSLIINKRVICHNKLNKKKNVLPIVNVNHPVKR